jgi:ABC-2 type transport system permease protein
MIGAVKPYFMVMRNSMMSGITYRAHFIFMALGNAFYVIVSYFLWQAIYAAQPSMNGLSFAQAYLQIAISMGIYGLLTNWTEWFMSSQIQGGDVVRYLTKPLDYQFSTMFDALGGTAMNFIGIAFPTIILGFALAGIPLPGPQAFLLCLLAILVGFFINFCIDFLIGLLGFITTSIWGISITKEIVVLFCSGAIIPLAFFPEGIRAVLDWLPFQAIYTTPVTLLITPGLPLDQVGWLLLKQLGWLVIIFAATRLAYGASMRRMVVNGG